MKTNTHKNVLNIDQMFQLRHYSNHWFLAGFSFLPWETSLDLFRIFSVFQACFNPGWDSKADFKSLENSWNRSMDQQERSSQCGLACGHTYSSPSWPSRWQPPWSCPPGAPPLPQTPSPASLGQVEPPVAQSSASKVQEKCAEGHGIGRQFLSLSPTFFVTLHFSFYCTAICSSKCLIGQTEKVESISRYGKCAEGLICSGCHRCQVEEKRCQVEGVCLPPKW